VAIQTRWMHFAESHGISRETAEALAPAMHRLHPAEFERVASEILWIDDEEFMPLLATKDLQREVRPFLNGIRDNR